MLSIFYYIGPKPPPPGQIFQPPAAWPQTSSPPQYRLLCFTLFFECLFSSRFSNLRESLLSFLLCFTAFVVKLCTPFPDLFVASTFYGFASGYQNLQKQGFYDNKTTTSARTPNWISFSNYHRGGVIEWRPSRFQGFVGLEAKGMLNFHRYLHRPLS